MCLYNMSITCISDGGEQVNIGDMRRKAKMTQEQLASQMDVTQSTISLWENDKTTPDAKQMIVLASVLGCSINDLYGVET